MLTYLGISEKSMARINFTLRATITEQIGLTKPKTNAKFYTKMQHFSFRENFSSRFFLFLGILEQIHDKTTPSCERI